MGKVSVIIPFYSGQTWLKEALESVIAQTYSDIEIILVNDGSEEDITGLISSYGDRIRYFTKTNGGPAAARNLGISYAKGEFLSFLDSDDIWQRDKIQLQVDFLEKWPLICWCHCTYSRFFDHSPKDLLPIGVLKGGDLFNESLFSCPIATPCVMIRSNVLNENNNLRFDEGTRYGEDTIFWYKLLAQFKLGYIDKSLVNVRLRGGNAAVQARVQLFARNQTYKHILSNGGQINGRKVPVLTRFCYFMAHLSFKVYNVTGSQSEWLAKLLYLPSWILIKTGYFIVK